ncbi:MAG TPA: cation/H(+) antiporter [Erysipelotrichaceae bacterium]|nr:cation/H(+) antiporter [Erysipelotrichaceae bacterium]
MSTTFFGLSLFLFGGLSISRLAKLLHLPNVTGFLFAGLLLGPYLFNIVPIEITENLDIISDLALGFIAFTIGSEFKLSYFKRVGITPIVIALFEAILAVVLVVIALLMMGQSLPFALVLGAIAAATAPAATVMVIKQYRSKGPVTETLLSVVAIDDAVALIVFGLNVAIAKALTGGNGSVLESLLSPLWELGFSLGAGAILGLILTFGARAFASRGNRLSLIFAFIVFAIALSNRFHGSSLLMIMSMSAVFANLYRDLNVMLEILDRATPPIFLLFFVLSGAHLNLAILPQVGVIGLVYIIVRVIGKVLGANLGARLTHAPENVRRYLGPALIPQAGVAIGLTFVAQSVVPEYAATIRAVVLCATLIYELVGPVVAKMTLVQAGEISQEMALKKLAH